MDSVKKEGRVKKVFAMVVSFAALILIGSNLNIIKNEPEWINGNIKYTEIIGTIEKGETLFDIFKKYGLDIAELFKLKEASADIHKLRKIQTGQSYKITIKFRIFPWAISSDIKDLQAPSWA